LLGFDANVVGKLAEWRKSLAEMGVDPDELEMFVKEKGPLEYQVSKLRATVKRMTSLIDVQEKRKKAKRLVSQLWLSKLVRPKGSNLQHRMGGSPNINANSKFHGRRR